MSSQRPEIIVQTIPDTNPGPATGSARDPFSSEDASPRRSESEKGSGGQTQLFSSRADEGPRTPLKHDQGSSDSHAREPQQFSPNQGFHPGSPTHLRSPRFSGTDYFVGGRPPLPRQSTRGTQVSVYNSVKFQSDGSYMIFPESKEIPITLERRLQPTIDAASAARRSFARTEKFYNYLHNAAVGLQVLLGSLTTGLSAVAATGGRSSAAQTTILGGLSTIVASYLANARGSDEPELSRKRVKDLDEFLRDCSAFVEDHGNLIVNTDKIDDPLNIRLRDKRKRLEEILGNLNPPDNKGPQKSPATQTQTPPNKNL